MKVAVSFDRTDINEASKVDCEAYPIRAGFNPRAALEDWSESPAPAVPIVTDECPGSRDVKW